MSAHDDVLAAAKKMLHIGLTGGTSGNISIRAEDGTVVITPSSVDYEDMTLGDLVVIDMDGNVVAGDRAPSSEKQLHLECYRAHADVAAVVHAHPLYASMFAAARKPIPAVLDEFAVYVGGDVACAEYGMSGTPELATLAAGQLGSVGTTLLANHGMVSVGSTPAKALHQSWVVERSAQILWGTAAIGGAVPLPDKTNEQFGAVYRWLRSQGKA
ncbi:MAG: class II aldolase/adducin family protein [Mycobacteriales bacterium]